MAHVTLACETDNQCAEAVRQAADTLRSGGVVVFPTETAYGVGAAIAAPEPVDRLRKIKDGDESQSFTLHLPDVPSIERFVDFDRHPALRRLARRVLPGPVAFIVPVDEQTIERKLDELGLPADARRRLYPGGTLSFRVPDHPVARALLEEVGEPIVASSANRNGEPAPRSVAQAADAVGDQVDLLLDGGPCRYSKPSTIVRVDGERTEILREGVYDRRYIEKLMQRNIIFVCSGNTCRSPMAEAIARQEIARRLHVTPDRLGQANVNVISAGVFAMPGSAITPEAEQALQELGVDAPRHVSRPLSPAMIEQAEVIFCMTPSHLEAVQAIAPGAASRVVLLDPEGQAVEDPIGAGRQIYVKCARQMRQFIRQRLDELGFDSSPSPVEKRP